MGKNDKVIYTQFHWKAEMQRLSVWVFRTNELQFTRQLNKAIISHQLLSLTATDLLDGEKENGWVLVPGESTLLLHQRDLCRQEATMNIW